MSAITYKAQAERLVSHLSAVHKIRLKHASALEAIAAVHAARDWNTLSARQEAPDVATVRAAAGGARAAAAALAGLFPSHSFSSPSFCDAMVRQTVLIGYGLAEQRSAIVRHLLRHQVNTGGGFLFVDARDDAASPEWLTQAMSHAGRQSCFHAVMPDGGGLLEDVDLLAQGEPDQLARVVLSFLPCAENSPDADFYRESARGVIEPVIAALQALAQPVTLLRMAEIIAYPEEKFIEIEAALPAGSDAHAHFKRMLDGYRTTPGGKLNARMLKGALGGISERLHVLLGAYGKTTNALARHPWSVSVRDGVGLHASGTAGRLLVASIAAAARSLREVERTRAFTVFVDGPNAHESVSPEVVQALQSAGIGLVVLSYRSIAGALFTLKGDVLSPCGCGLPVTVRVSNVAGDFVYARLSE
jgi:hypothetical protein